MGWNLLAIIINSIIYDTVTKIHLNKWGVKFRLQDQRRKLQVQNTTYMIIAENYNIMAEV